MNRVPLFGCLFFAVAAGCATLRPHLGFDQVAQEVSNRSGLRVQWDTGSEADEEVRKAVASLLDSELTAEKAMQVALLNNRELQAVYEELHVAQADLVQAGLLKNPVFNGDLRFATTGGGPAAELGIADDFMSLLSLPLRKGRAQAAFEAEKLCVAGIVLDLAGEVRSAFYEAQAAEQLQEMRATVLDASTASYELAKLLRKAGNVRELDLANERALLEQAKIDLASAETQALTQRERLNELMGLWGREAKWKMAARLPEVPTEEQKPDAELERLAVDQSLDLKIAAKRIEVDARTLGITDATRFINEASIGISAQREVSDNRGVQSQRRRAWYDLVGEGVTNAVRREPPVWPPLNPNGAAHSYNGIWSLGPSWSLPVPIFDQGQALVASAQARLRQSVAEYFALAVRLRARLRLASLASGAAREKAVYYQRIILPLRHKIVDETQLQYNAMQASAFQLLQAKRDEINSGAEYIETLRSYWLARANLDLTLNGRMARGTPRTLAMSLTGASRDDGMDGGRDGKR